MAEAVGIFFVVAASVSWYVSKSLESKVDPDKDGYGEGMKYVKHNENDLPTYKIRLSSRASESSKKFIVIYIEGIGCKDSLDKSGKYDVKYINELKQRWGIENDELIVECDKKQTMAGIAVRGLKKEHIPFGVKHQTTFIDPLSAKVKEFVLEDKNNIVLLAGHSYGGEIACRVAERASLLLRQSGIDPVDRGTLRLSTFGSIYIFDSAKSENVKDVTHYMIKDDIALKLNGLKTPVSTADEKITFPYIKKDTDIFWLDHKSEVNARWNPMNDTRWGLHKRYEEIIKAVMMKRGLRLDVDEVKLY